jgi:hypothetical protein
MRMISSSFPIHQSNAMTLLLPLWPMGRWLRTLAILSKQLIVALWMLRVLTLTPLAPVVPHPQMDQKLMLLSHV